MIPTCVYSFSHCVTLGYRGGGGGGGGGMRSSG